MVTKAEISDLAKPYCVAWEPDGRGERMTISDYRGAAVSMTFYGFEVVSSCDFDHKFIRPLIEQIEGMNADG